MHRPCLNLKRRFMMQNDTSTQWKRLNQRFHPPRSMYH